MPTYNRPRKKSRVNWDWERAAQGGISGAAYGFKAGGPKGAIAGAVIGGGIGGLTGRDTSIDRAPYEEALEHYGIGRRKDARRSADELAAQTGAALAVRGVNNSAMAAGVVSANRGRIMTAAESDIGKMRADIYASIAEAERNAEAAYDAETRQGWLNLAQQLGFQALEYSMDQKAEKAALAKRFERLEKPPKVTEPPKLDGDVTFDPPFPTDIIGNPDRGLGLSPMEGGTSIFDAPDPALPNPDDLDGGAVSTDDPFPELRSGESNPGMTEAWRRAKQGTTSVPPVNQEWQWDKPPPIDTSPGRKRQLEETLDPEEMSALDEIFPDGKLDEILGDTSPGKMRELDPSVPPERRRPRIPEGKIPIKSAAGLTTHWVDAPDTSVGKMRELEEPTYEMEAAEDDLINVTPIDIESEWISPAKMGELPSYFAYIYDDEQGYNPDDPSYAGITQQTYTEWRNRERMWGAPEDVRELATNPAVISIFYEDYLRDANVPQSFMRNPALEYMYVDFAIHGGHSGARRIYQRALRSLRAQGITHASDQELLQAFNREKRNFYELQGANSASFLTRADRVYSRASRMMGGS